MIEARHIRISDGSSVGEARREAARLAHEIGLHELEAGRLAIVVVELAKNAWKHAGGGEVLLTPRDDAAGIEVLAIDKGPGIRDLDRALGDGFSTAGTAGTGLGAARRQSQQFDIYSRADKGSAVVARVYPQPHVPSPATWAGVNVPKSGEQISGDAFAVERRGGRVVAMVADGLGHGPDAAAASRAAVAALRKEHRHAPDEILESMHEALRTTRGAAVCIAVIDSEAATIDVCSVGNVSASLVSGGSSSGFLATHGTVGANLRKASVERRAWPADGVLLLASDGVRPRWQVGDYPGLWHRDPALVAGTLYCEYCSGRDDATMLAVRT